MSVDAERVPNLAYTPEAGTEATKYMVSPEIHAEDFIYQFHLEIQPEPHSDAARASVTEYYFRDGNRSATRLDELIRQYHPRATERALSLLEFASGYGCVTRHLARMSGQYSLTTCDIHEQAIHFLSERLATATICSCSDPAAFNANATFDVVFALSFFSHMPHLTFGGWIKALYATLAKDGLLIFTTHGRNDLNRPDATPDGYWFAEMSEQKDIPTHEYGCMIVTPSYVIDKIGRLPGAVLIGYQEGFWWGKQDVFIVQKTGSDFQSQTDTPMLRSDGELHRLHEVVADLQCQIANYQNNVQALHDAMIAVRRSNSWRVTKPLRAVSSLLGRR